VLVTGVFTFWSLAITKTSISDRWSRPGRWTGPSVLNAVREWEIRKWRRRAHEERHVERAQIMVSRWRARGYTSRHWNAVRIMAAARIVMRQAGAQPQMLKPPTLNAATQRASRHGNAITSASGYDMKRRAIAARISDVTRWQYGHGQRSSVTVATERRRDTARTAMSYARVWCRVALNGAACYNHNAVENSAFTTATNSGAGCRW